MWPFRCPLFKFKYPPCLCRGDIIAEFQSGVEWKMRLILSVSFCNERSSMLHRRFINPTTGRVLHEFRQEINHVHKVTVETTFFCPKRLSSLSSNRAHFTQTGSVVVSFEQEHRNTRGRNSRRRNYSMPFLIHV
ncbi:hypothetical protein CDAR_227841 [Caerostris darwini]|uniref:Uncharacterized protein n=1 Tax=Caerostris darwini TaxID=1538125 RepID=A0AAV4PKG6_9ARAC|nr:hypothetical protein CDAR_227841 [Caerostris darwini]